MKKLQILLKNEIFQNRVCKAARITLRTGHESGFKILKKKNKIFFDKVIKGGCDSIKLKSEPSVILEGSLHIHPIDKGLIIPSFQDLMSLSWFPFDDDILHPPVERWTIIGLAQKKRIILLYLEPVRTIIRDEIKDWEKEIDDFPEIVSREDIREELQKEINKKLTELGLRVEIDFLFLS